MIEEEIRKFGPMIADHQRPQFSSAYLLIIAGGITTDINGGSNIKADKKSTPNAEISSSETRVWDKNKARIAGISRFKVSTGFLISIV